MRALELQPTSNQNFRIVGHGSRGNLAARLDASVAAANSGDIDTACNMRYEAFQDIMACLPDDDSVVELDRNHGNTLAAMRTIYYSALDSYLIADYEMASAQLELLIDCDNEDPLEATPLLALCYCGLGEWECLEDIDTDLGDKSIMQPLCRAISSFVQTSTCDSAAIAQLKRDREFCCELCSDSHPTDESYSRDIYSDHPSKKAIARESYLLCEPILKLHNGLLPTLKSLLQ